jgi:hypothetical protein
MSHTDQPDHGWKKIVTSGSQAHLKSLYSEGSFIIDASLIKFHGLPTSDPYKEGELWNNNNFLYVSLG